MLRYYNLTKDNKNQQEIIPSPSEWIKAVLKAPYSDSVKDALLVRLADNTVDMYGATKVDMITPDALMGHSRLSVQVHPYPWRPSGASNVVVYIDPFGRRRVALVYNIRRDKRPDGHALKVAGVPNDWRLPEGYMHPKPCKGGEQGIALLHSDDMDEAEELILKKVPHGEAYKQIAKKSQHGVYGRMLHGFDKTIQDCARREVHEEVGLNPSNECIHFITMHDDNAAVGLYLIDASSKHPSPPALKADGVEIKHAEWGRIEAFEIKNVDGLIKVTHPYYDDDGNEFAVEVPLKYALIIGKGIELSRKMELEIASKNPGGLSLFSERRNVEAQIMKILQSKRLNPDNLKMSDILGNTPEMYLEKIGYSEQKNVPVLAQLGKSAEQYHTTIRCFGHFFSTAPVEKIFSAADLVNAGHGFSEISQNIASSKVHSFLKMK